MDLIRKFVQANDIEPITRKVIPKTKSTKSSQSEGLTYQLYQEGKNIFQIAQERNMSPNTVEEHLVSLVKKKAVEPETLISKDDILNIRLAYRRQESNFLKPLKEHFGDRYSYFQLKVALAEEREG
jgi:ATP-dependent DNA helicase RecQ